mmetsp:Transcript_67039/g.143432  ORF Transcript_67039/g.143432 Transcript_67039/m.143432 type:complete len:425 (-) Transcript_67039:114-1388(-)
MATPMIPAWRGQEASSASSLTCQAVARVDPSSKAPASGALGPISLLGAGAGGVETLSRHLGMGLVSWALLRFQVGGGTFARAKLVAISCSSGEAAPAALLGRLAARGNEARRLLGEVHAHISINTASELTAEYLCARLLPLFSADTGRHCSVQSLRLEYSLAVAQVRRGVMASHVPSASDTVVQAEATADEALQAVGTVGGRYDWVLLEPSRLQVHSAGSGGIEEMKGHLAEDRVLFGVLRISFGDVTRLLPQSEGSSGRRKTFVPRQITRHVLIHWMGAHVGAVQRGRWNARLQSAAAQIAVHCTIALRCDAQSLQDVELEDLISQLRRMTPAVVVAASGAVGSGPSSAMQHFVALGAAAERSSVTAPPAPEVRPPEAPRMPELSAAIEAVRQTSGEWDWLLCGWRRPSLAAAMPPSPAHGGA